MKCQLPAPTYSCPRRFLSLDQTRYCSARPLKNDDVLLSDAKSYRRTLFKRLGHHVRHHHGCKEISCYPAHKSSWFNLQRWGESSWSSSLLTLTGIAAAVSALAVTTLASATATASAEWLALRALSLAAHHSTWWSVGTLLLDVGSWDNLGWEMEPLAQVVETLWGEGVVVVLPRELGLDETTGGERLAGLDDVQVLCVDVVVLWKVEVLLGDEDTLTEEVLVDLLAVGLWDEPIPSC